MKVTFLGTGAADWTEEDWAKEGFKRRLTCALVNTDLLIDCGPTLFDSAEAEGVSLNGVRFVLSTHLHCDHFSLTALETMGKNQNITFVCPTSAVYATASLPEIEVIGLPLYETVSVGGYRITAVPASHVVSDHPESRPVHYIITHEEQTIFWGCDGCWLPCESWQYVKKCRFDMAVLDSTFGDIPELQYLFEHNNLTMVESLVGIWRAGHILSENGIVYANHIAKICNLPHEALAERYAKSRISVAYDGLTVTVPKESSIAKNSR